MRRPPIDRLAGRLRCPCRRDRLIRLGGWSRRTRTVGSVATLALTVAVLVFPAAASAELPYPSPLEGPGVGELKRSEAKRLDRAWRELSAGNTERSSKLRARAGNGPPARLLESQIGLFNGDDVTEALRELCLAASGYAAAWVTLSVSAERAADEVLALDAARTAAGLWPSSEWARRAHDLEVRWIDDRLDAAENARSSGELDDALTLIGAARVHDPDRPRALLLKAEVLYDSGRPDESETVLTGIADLPESLGLLGRIAEDRQDWQSAMEAYSALPEDDPVRTTALERVQIRWRLTMLPSYAQSAMASAELTRSELAVIVVSARPQLETMPGGSIPVMSDIVDHPGQREIITVVRLGLMSADQIGHLFYPDRKVETDAVRKVIRQTRALLGLDPLIWCGEPNVVGSGCTSISSPPRGGDVVSAVLDSVTGADP